MDKHLDIEILKLKLEELRGIWSNYFYTYPYFYTHVKFTEEEKSNYVGVLFGHFLDLFDIVFSPIDKVVDYSVAYRFYISLFQGIYVQQDFIEELLIIFRTGIQRGELDKNPDFKLNRDIRNEFVGHPISRDKHHNLTSSSIIGFDSNSNQLCYLKYQFPVETDVIQKISAKDVLSRHVTLLNKYFDVLLEKSYIVLSFFEKNILDKITELIDKENFDAVFCLLDTHFKIKLNDDCVLSIEQYKLIGKNRSHPRYIFTFQRFIKEVGNDIVDIKKSLKGILDKVNLDTERYTDVEGSGIIPALKFVNRKHKEGGKQVYVRENYNYELGKLYNNNNNDVFDFNCNTIIEENKDDAPILEEIEHMKENRNDDLEYYSSWYYLKQLLKTKLENNKNL